MADQVFRQRRGKGAAALLVVRVGIFLLLPGAMAVDDEAGNDVVMVLFIVLAVCMLGFSFCEWRYRPFEVTLTEDGVLLRSRARDRFIPWWALASVGLSDSRRFSVTWRQRDGRSVKSTTFPNTSRLFAEIGRRSPDTQLS